MTLSNLITQLKSMSGFQVAFDGLNTEMQVSFPYINVLSPTTNTFSADNITYFQTMGVELGLYTKYKDTINEATLENKLTSLGLYYKKQDIGHIDQQSCYEVIYEIGV